MADYYFPEVNTNGQFTDPKVIADIQAKAKSSIDAVVPPNGTEGHALVKTSTGTKWGSVESPYELRGTGFPEGKVTANPGTYYTDTDVTNGAWRWFKKSGTGNTGWVVQDGDTGWRTIPYSELVDVAKIQDQFWTNVRVRRIGNVVHISAAVLPVAGVTGNIAMWKHPDGWRFTGQAGWNSQQPTALGMVGNGNDSRNWLRYNNTNSANTTTYWLGVSATTYATLTGPCDDNWPSTLPGTAA